MRYKRKRQQHPEEPSLFMETLKFYSPLLALFVIFTIGSVVFKIEAINREGSKDQIAYRQCRSEGVSIFGCLTGLR